LNRQWSVAEDLVEEQFCSLRLWFIEKVLRSLIFYDPPLIHEDPTITAIRLDGVFFVS